MQDVLCNLAEESLFALNIATGERGLSKWARLPTDVIVFKIQDHMTLNRHSTVSFLATHVEERIFRVCFKVDYIMQCPAKIVVSTVVGMVRKPLMSHFFKIPTVKNRDSDFT